MKKKVLAIALVTVFTGMGVAQAADVTAQAVATWSATAKKDTTSKLVVTPLGSLAFQYAEGIKGFNSQKGLFDVAIEGDSTATAFKLTSRLITNTLTQLDTSGSTLNVGVDYNGAAVEKTGDTVMIDTANGVLGGNLSPLANGYNASNRTTAQDGFTFSIISGTTNGTTAVTDYSTLPEGIWSGLAYSSTRPGPVNLSDVPAGVAPPALFLDGIVMKKHLLPLALLFSGISPAQALDVGDISSFMNSDSSTLSKTIKNSTDSGRLINIRLERLSSPLDDGQVISMDKPDELLLTPASLLLPAQASEVIRFFYKGPADEKERYYRIVWFDQALSDAQRDNANRSAVATASARIGTILVVAPRQANYHFQYANGSLTNTGNATLRILAYGPCLKAANGKECKENYYLMPGKSRRFTRVDTADNKGRVALWQGDKFIPVK